MLENACKTMCLVLKIKLYTTEDQHQSLLKTMRMFNNLCNDISAYAFQNGVFSGFSLEKLCRDIRIKHDAHSRFLTRSVAIVGASYRNKKPVEQNVFSPYSAIVYDERILRFIGAESVRLLTVDGYLEIPVAVYDRKMFRHHQGQSDLIYQNKKWYLLITIKMPCPEERQTEGVLGLDLGVKNIAVTSDGKIFSAEHVENKRQKYFKHRQSLQACNSRNARRRLKKIGSREARFRRDVNHCISKRIIKHAVKHNKTLAVEDLTHINTNTKVRKANRNERMSWSFAQLQQFIAYKAELAGLPVITIDPKYTSQICSACSHHDKHSRKNQSEFSCTSCGYTSHADFNAAKNIAKAAESLCVTTV